MLLVENNFEKIRDQTKWPSNALKKDASDEPPPHYLLVPKNPQIKIIDFGGATFSNDYHGAVINTRQYRAPEVILQCCQWSEKSDIWSAACIIAELYTGDMLFTTHDSVEHLVLIEKIVGDFPNWMVEKADKDYKNCFEKHTDHFEKWKLKWPEKAESKDSIKNVQNAKNLYVFL